jgi:hypothetical protein
MIAKVAAWSAMISGDPWAIGSTKGNLSSAGALG